MATERELKAAQEAILFDILRLLDAGSEDEMREMLLVMSARAQSGMTVEEVAAVRERVASSKRK